VTRDSWWICPDDDFAARAVVAAARMACDKSRVLYSTNPHQFRDPPRRPRPTLYTYALEAAHVE